MKKLLLTTLSLFCALSLQAAQQQPQEVSFKNKQNLTLRGSFWHAPSDSVIIMVHGAGNNRNANGMFPLLADTFQKQGYNILTFDMAGHGKSDNVTFDLPQVEDDVTAAISFCKKKNLKTYY